MPLERPHGAFGICVEHAVCGIDFRNVREIGRNAVKARLNRADILGKVAQPQCHAGERPAEVGRERCTGDEIDVAAVKRLQDLLGGKSLLGQRHGSPLAKPARTGDGRAVAVLREQRLDRVAAGEVSADHIIYNGGNILENIPSGHKGLVIPRGIGDIKIVALRAVPFGEHTVEHIGHLCVHVGADGLLGPGRINLGRGNIFDVIGKRYGDILRIRGRRTEVHRDGFRYGNIGFGQSNPSFYGFSGNSGSSACGAPVAVRSVCAKL